MPYVGDIMIPMETYEGPGAMEWWDDLIDTIDQMCAANGVIE